MMVDTFLVSTIIIPFQQLRLFFNLFDYALNNADYVDKIYNTVTV